MKKEGRLLFQETLLFLGIVLLESVILGDLALSHRMVAGHDGFHYFALQYYFLNNAVISGEIPQWMPFMAHGMTASWWYAIQGSLLQNVLLIFPKILTGFNFLTIFYAGLWVDSLLLLIGTWLLGKRFFSSTATVFFVAVAVVGSAVWTSQPWFNFHLIYALPLILHFLHSFLESGRWRYCFLAGNLLALQTIGNLPDFFPAVSLVLVLYLLSYAFFNTQEIVHRLKNLRWGLPFGMCLLFTAGSFVPVYAILKGGAGQIVQYNIGRHPDGSVPLNVFLTYGGNQGLAKWSELFLGFSPALDYTLRIGLLCLPLALLGLVFHPNRRHLHFLLVAVTMGLFSMGTPVAAFFYCCWPLMKFYRHIGFLACFTKLFLCFLAGFGFEAILVRWKDLVSDGKRPRAGRRLVGCLPFLLLALSLCLFVLAHNPDAYLKFLAKAFAREPWELFYPALSKGVLCQGLQKSARVALLAAALCGGALRAPQRYRRHLIAFALALQVCDLYGAKFSDALLKTTRLTDGSVGLTLFQPMPYQPRRTLSLEASNPRTAWLSHLPLFGAIVGITHSFLFADEVSSSLRIDYWELPLDKLMRAYWGQPIHDQSRQPAGLVPFHRLDFPLQHPASRKIAGLTQDKIQFFSRAILLDREEEIVRAITDPRYNGDLLFLSSGEDSGPPERVSQDSQLALSSSARMKLPYEVRRFNANHLEISVNVPEGEPVWLSYSDVWHPQWRANVNGEDVPIFRANLAYKAVRLPSGENRIHFSFCSKAFSIVTQSFGFNALAWLVFLVWTSGRICWGGLSPAAGSRASREARS